MVIQIQQGQEREQPEQGTARHGQGCELEHFWQGVRSDKAQWTVWAWVHPPQFPWLVWLRTGTVGEAGGDSSCAPFCSQDSGQAGG